jgi:hypothetical protein
MQMHQTSVPVRHEEMQEVGEVYPEIQTLLAHPILLLLMQTLISTH